MRKLTAIQGQLAEFGVLRAIHAGSRQFDLRVGIKGRGVTGIPSSIRDLASSGFASP